MPLETSQQKTDLALSAFLFTPLVCLFWHGLFGIFDAVILSDYPVTGAWLILIIGTSAQIIISCLQNEVIKFLTTKPYSSQKKYLIGYNLTVATVQIMQFRGLNDIYEQNIGVGVFDAIRATCTAVVLMLSLRLCTQVVDMPFTLSLDTDSSLQESFQFVSYFNTKVSRSRVYFLGC